MLVRQPRVAVGRMTWEVPAGMVDRSGCLKGHMLEEIKQETGISVNIDDLHHHGSTYTSPGILDETLELYSLQLTCTDETFRKNGKQQGLQEEGEVVTNVEAVYLDDPRVLEDAKLRTLLSVVDVKDAPYKENAQEDDTHT